MGASNVTPAARLSALLGNARDSTSLTSRLILLNIENARSKNPELAWLLQACAIPHTFDAAIIGVLQGNESNLASSENFLRELCAYSFVQQCEDGSFAYHDTFRQGILDIWEEPGRKTEVDHIKSRLAQHYAATAAHYLTLNDGELGLKGITRAIELQPQEPKFRILRGSIYSLLNQRIEAFEDFSIAISSEPENSTAYNLRANELISLARLDEADADLDRAIEIAPGNSQSLYLKGASAFRRGNVDTAVSLLTKAIEAGPTAITYWARARAYMRLRFYKHAIFDLNLALSLEKEAAFIYSALGYCQLEISNPKDSIEAFSEAIALSPKSADNYHLRGLSQLRNGNYSEATKDLEMAKSIEPKAIFDYWLALISLGDGNYGSCLTKLQQLRPQIQNQEALANCYIPFWCSICLKLQRHQKESEFLLNQSRAAIGKLDFSDRPWRFHGLLEAYLGDEVESKSQYLRIFEHSLDNERIATQEIYLWLLQLLFSDRRDIGEIRRWLQLAIDTVRTNPCNIK